MKQLVKNNNTGILSLEETPIPMLKKGHLLVQNRFSAVSNGEEKPLSKERNSTEFKNFNTLSEMNRRVDFEIIR